MASNQRVQYLNDAHDRSFEFNPFDSDTWPSDDEEEVDTDTLIQYNASPEASPRLVPQHFENADDSPSVFFSDNIDNSKRFVQQILNNRSRQLHITHTPGLVILPIQDFNLIRNDTRHNRVIRHLIIFPHLENNFENQYDLFQNYFLNEGTQLSV